MSLLTTLYPTSSTHCRINQTLLNIMYHFQGRTRASHFSHNWQWHQNPQPPSADPFEPSYISQYSDSDGDSSPLIVCSPTWTNSRALVDYQPVRPNTRNAIFHTPHLHYCSETNNFVSSNGGLRRHGHDQPFSTPCSISPEISRDAGNEDCIIVPRGQYIPRLAQGGPYGSQATYYNPEHFGNQHRVGSEEFFPWGTSCSNEIDNSSFGASVYEQSYDGYHIRMDQSQGIAPICQANYETCTSMASKSFDCTVLDSCPSNNESY